MVVFGGILAAALIALAPDAGAPDAGAPDAGAPDAGAPDAGVSASGASTAGTSGDAGAQVEPLGTDTPIDCAAPDRPPSPRCGESLDGRDSPPTSPARRAARAVLAPPRAVARLAFIPVVEGTAMMERHSVVPWLTALTTSDDGKVGVRPQLQYATGFIPSIGLGIFYRRLRDPGSEVTARFRVGSTDVWRVEGGLHGPAWLGLSIGAIWDRRDDRIFAGIGVQSVDAPNVKARYGGDIFKVEATWVAPRRTGPFAFQLRAGADGRSYHSNAVRGGPSVALAYGAAPETCAALGVPSPCTDPAQMPGFYGGRQLLYQRARVALDLRPGGRSRSGVELGLDGTFVQGIINDPSRHVRTAFDAVTAIGGGDRVLLLRFTGAVVQPVGNAPVPFDEMISPTGGLWNRGLIDGLIRDRSGVAGTAEYRWLISSALDAALFIDESAVAGAWFAGLAPDSFRASVGAGLRFYRRGFPRYWDDSLQNGIQVAFSRGQGVRLLLTAAAF
jgi:hypothetical protein